MGEGNAGVGEQEPGRHVSVAAVEMVDVVFDLRGRAIALDYADRLLQELSARLPWLAGETIAAVHPLAGVSPGDTELYFTRRARLALRLPVKRRGEARALTGARLDLGGEVEVGEAREKPLEPAKVLYSSFVTVGESEEQRFLEVCCQRLSEAGLGAYAIDRLVCGKARRAAGEDGEWMGYSLMLHDLKADDSMRLQQVGLGGERKRGCGIFVPHKAIVGVAE